MKHGEPQPSQQFMAGLASLTGRALPKSGAQTTERKCGQSYASTTAMQPAAATVRHPAMTGPCSDLSILHSVRSIQNAMCVSEERTQGLPNQGLTGALSAQSSHTAWLQYHAHHRGSNASIQHWRKTRYIQGYDRTQPDTLVDPHKASLEIPDFLKPGRGGRSDDDQKDEGKKQEGKDQD